jgi:NAD(P)-dependent dehydrogenase (short-subunit alcohol dehydrogenase family)
MKADEPGHRQRLAGHRVVVTGAAGGIGAATVSRLQAEGARVVGIDLRHASRIIAADVTDRASISEAITEAVRRLGGIDILVNNAGIGTGQDTGDFPDEESRRIMEVNFFGAWNTTAAAMPHLLASCGHVVNIASALALVDVPYVVAYSASKRAVDTYSRLLRLEYKDRLSVTTIHPGYVKTPIHDRAGELGLSVEGLVHEETVEQAAAAVAHACVRKPRSLTLTRRSAGEFMLARNFPILAARYLEWKWKRIHASAPAPTFLRFPQTEPTHDSLDREPIEVAR